jgi:electron transport complex protein RnfB
MQDLLVERIDAILPQTQCRKCGFSGCKPYALAIAKGEADINQCPPGGDESIQMLAQLLGVEAKPLNPEYGTFKAKAAAFIDESRCIGCMLCIHTCPVDAILGAAKYMHTVIAAECTGCELCMAPCPVDCISMQPALSGDQGSAERNKQAADVARERYEFRLYRIEREKAERAETLLANQQASKAHSALAAGSASGTPRSEVDAAAKAKQAVIQAAIARVKAKKARAKLALSAQSKP